MIQITHVLCPVDFSEFSKHALEHAAAVAKWYEARLTVLYVFPNLPAMDLPPLVLDDEDRARVLTELEHFTADVPPGVPVSRRIQEASQVDREIVSQVSALGADLLVIGSHGRSGFERLLLGSVAEKVIRRAPCPALVVPRRAAHRGAAEPVRSGRILCPIDFSEGSAQALNYALSLAEEADAQLTVLHVIEVPPELLADPMAEGFDVDRARAAAEAERLRRLRALIPPEAQTYCTVETAVREGAAYRQILAVANAQDVDLIVMGVQGRGAIERLVFGSNTAQVTRAAACPVLIVPRG